MLNLRLQLKAMWQVNDKNRETVHTWIAVGLILSGVGAFFTALLMPPIGEVDNSVLAYVGEAFALAGGLLGIVQYVNGRFASFAKKNKLEE